MSARDLALSSSSSFYAFLGCKKEMKKKKQWNVQDKEQNKYRFGIRRTAASSCFLLLVFFIII